LRYKHELHNRVPLAPVIRLTRELIVT